MARTIRLNDTQLVLLSTAAGREDRMVLPPPKSVPYDDPATRKALQGLLKRDLVEEVAVALDAPAWRTGESDQPLGLVITAAGFDAIGLGEMAGKAPATSRRKAFTKASKPRGESARKRKATRTTARKPAGRKDETQTRETKAEAVVALLRRKSGATVTQMMEASGWQAHSVRGFLSGTVKTRMGLALTSEKAEGSERRYRIEGGKA